MSYDLETTSHGVILAGFSSGLAAVVLFGDYNLGYSNFCSGIERLAQGQGALLDHYPDEVYDGLMGYYSSMYLSGMQADPFYVPSEPLTVVSSLAKAGSIVVGKYEISFPDFAFFARYVARGGSLGMARPDAPLPGRLALESMARSKIREFREASIDRTNIF